MDTPNLPGTLYIVATPVGNLEDITFRAIKVLKQVDMIAAEDTRHSKKLLAHYGITTKMVSCHEHNEISKTPQLIARLQEGQNIALISDAGTPGISDPGYTLVRAVAKENLPIIPIPGCSAAIAGLSVSGLPTDSFLFLGFLPRKHQKLEQAIAGIANQRATLIIYESPRRIKSLVDTMIRVVGDRKAFLAREITKLHEEYIRGNLSGILETLGKKETIKGECSLFVQGQREQESIDEGQLEKVVRRRLKTHDGGTSALAGQVAREFAVSKKQVYDLILKLNQG